jgi:hypothetical protein
MVSPLSDFLVKLSNNGAPLEISKSKFVERGKRAITQLEKHRLIAETLYDHARSGQPIEALLDPRPFIEFEYVAQQRFIDALSLIARQWTQLRLCTAIAIESPEDKKPSCETVSDNITVNDDALASDPNLDAKKVKLRDVKKLFPEHYTKIGSALDNLLKGEVAAITFKAIDKSTIKTINGQLTIKLQALLTAEDVKRFRLLEEIILEYEQGIPNHYRNLIGTISKLEGKAKKQIIERLFANAIPLDFLSHNIRPKDFDRFSEHYCRAIKQRHRALDKNNSSIEDCFSVPNSFRVDSVSTYVNTLKKQYFIYRKILSAIIFIDGISNKENQLSQFEFTAEGVEEGLKTLFKHLIEIKKNKEAVLLSKLSGVKKTGVTKEVFEATQLCYKDIVEARNSVEAVPWDNLTYPKSCDQDPQILISVFKSKTLEILLLAKSQTISYSKLLSDYYARIALGKPIDPIKSLTEHLHRLVKIHKINIKPPIKIKTIGDITPLVPIAIVLEIPLARKFHKKKERGCENPYNTSA